MVSKNMSASSHLSQILSGQDFQAEAFVRDISQGGDSAEDLFQARKQIQTLSDETSKALKNNVYKNYTQFIDTAREISYLEGEMYQLSHMLTEQKSLIDVLSDLSFTHGKVEQKKQVEEKKLDDADIRKSTGGLMRILEKVEGCSDITEVPGRKLVYEGDLVELDTDSLSPLRNVRAFLMSDCLLISNWLSASARKGPVKYKFQSFFKLDGLAVVNVRDIGSVKNAFKILMFPDARVYQCDSPKTKKLWLDKIDEMKKVVLNKVSQKKELPPESPNPFTEKTSHEPTNPFAESKQEEESPDMLDVDWLKEVPDDLDVCIAQRDFDGAVDLIDKTQDYLDKCPKTLAIKDYRSKLEMRLRQLCEVLTSELKVSAGTKLQGGPRAARRAVHHLIRLDKSSLACKLFLKQRSVILRHSLKQLKLDQGAAIPYIKRLCSIFFNNMQATIQEFSRAFSKCPGSYSALTVWCISEFEYFTVVFGNETFTGENTLSTTATCTQIADKCCIELREQGVDLSYGFYSMITEQASGVITRSKDKLMEVNKRNAVEDKWKPLNLENKASLDKFLGEMSDIGIASIHAFIYDGCCISLTRNTTQFSRSYLTYIDDVLRMHHRTYHVVIVKCLVDLFKAQLLYIEASLKSDKYAKEHKFILKNAHFLLETVLTLAEHRFEQHVGFPCKQLSALHRELHRLKGVAKNTVVAYV